MKNLLLIAFATLAMSLGANVLNACPACEGQQVVKTDKKADKAEASKEVKKAEAKDANAHATADTAEAKTDSKAVATAKAESCKGCGTCKRASAGQAVRADRDCAGTCKKAANGEVTASDGGCCGGCGSGCGSGGCDKGDCGGCGSGGCDTAKADKKAEPVKN